MKQLLFIGLLFLLTTQQILSQTQNVDSLINVLETQKLTIVEQMELYQKLCNFYQYNDPEKRLEYYKKGYRSII